MGRWTWLVSAAGAFCLTAGATGASAESTFAQLKERLIRDGCDTRWIASLYADTRCEFLSTIAQINMKHVEDTAAYASFLDEKNMIIAREYFEKHRMMIGQCGKRTGVPPEIVVAILLIESKCGNDRSKAPVFNVLSTLSVSDHPRHIEASYAALKPQYPDLTIGQISRRAQSRSRWAYRELRTYLNWIRRHPGMDALAAGGSWAGAMGLPQFMPTAMAAYAADGDADGRIDLDNDTDAVASICRYLRGNGWRAELPAAHQRKIIWRYNQSPLYVETVLRVAEKLGLR